MINHEIPNKRNFVVDPEMNGKLNFFLFFTQKTSLFKFWTSHLKVSFLHIRFQKIKRQAKYRLSEVKAFKNQYWKFLILIFSVSPFAERGRKSCWCFENKRDSICGENFLFGQPRPNYLFNFLLLKFSLKFKTAESSRHF